MLLRADWALCKPLAHVSGAWRLCSTLPCKKKQKRPVNQQMKHKKVSWQNVILLIFDIFFFTTNLPANEWFRILGLHCENRSWHGETAESTPAAFCTRVPLEQLRLEALKHVSNFNFCNCDPWYKSSCRKSLFFWLTFTYLSASIRKSWYPNSSNPKDSLTQFLLSTSPARGV